MTMGLPSHVALRAMSLALSRAAHGMSLAVLCCGLVVALGFAAAYPDRVLWPALLALAVMFPMVWFVQRHRTLRAGLAYLAIGAGATYVHTITYALAVPHVLDDLTLWLAPPKIVLVLVAAGGVGLGRAVVWLLAGYVVAEVSASVALVLAGVPYVFDLLTLALLLEAIGVCLLAFLSVRGAVRAHPRLQHAAREELLDDLRSRMEVRAAALMHDTILSHLAAIASSSGAELDDRQKEQIDRDLQILSGQEWINSASDTTAAADSLDRASPLRDAIAQVRDEGLEVTGTGDFGSVLRLSPEQAQALGLAAKQCLVNVIKHSGVMTAEVAVYASDDEVSVMIIDAGRGFSEASVGSDRLGLRASVQSRIESVGGLVQVWSTPGAGTSVLIQFPVGETAQVPPQTGPSRLVSGPLPTITLGDRGPGDAGPAS